MTAAIAMACAGTSGIPACTSSSRRTRFSAQRHEAHRKVPGALLQRRESSCRWKVQNLLKRKLLVQATPKAPTAATM